MIQCHYRKLLMRWIFYFVNDVFSVHIIFYLISSLSLLCLFSDLTTNDVIYPLFSNLKDKIAERKPIRKIVMKKFMKNGQWGRCGVKSMFYSIQPEQIDNAIQMQGATGNERQWEDFRRIRKNNPEQETRDKPLLLFKRTARSLKRWCQFTTHNIADS